MQLLQFASACKSVKKKIWKVGSLHRHSVRRSMGRAILEPLAHSHDALCLEATCFLHLLLSYTH